MTDDCKAAALDHIEIAQKTIADCIDACVSMYVGDLGPTGQTFKNFADQLREAERDLSRAEGELRE
jgi:hypothetical protein